MQPVKVILVVSPVTASACWVLAAASLWADPLRGPGRTVLLAVTAGTSTLACLAAWLHAQREKRSDDRLREIEAEYRRREAALLKIVRLALGGPTSGPHRLLYPVASAGERR